MSTETVVQQQVRLALAQSGALMWRNNCGAYVDDNGRHVRYGLCNDSAQLNRRLKSSDLVGVFPILVQPHHVGQTFGLITVVECKKSGWHLTPGDERGQAQLRFIELVRSVGGIGGFATDVTDLPRIIGR